MTVPRLTPHPRRRGRSQSCARASYESASAPSANPAVLTKSERGSEGFADQRGVKNPRRQMQPAARAVVLLFEPHRYTPGTHPSNAASNARRCILLFARDARPAPPAPSEDEQRPPSYWRAATMPAMLPPTSNPQLDLDMGDDEVELRRRKLSILVLLQHPSNPAWLAHPPLAASTPFAPRIQQNTEFAAVASRVRSRAFHKTDSTTRSSYAGVFELVFVFRWPLRCARGSEDHASLMLVLCKLALSVGPVPHGAANLVSAKPVACLSPISLILLLLAAFPPALLP
ncbi:hypothetical protein C8R47DRAFT_515981 [Mycena vitilis]|nr:hypothetical protein C8R47DRAFT_515981 [Mycena vitilis]